MARFNTMTGASLRLVSLALAISLSTACTQVAWRAYSSSEVPQPAKNCFLKLHIPDGRLYVLSPWRVDSENVVGNGLLYGRDRNKPMPGDFTVSLKDIASVEVDSPESILNRDQTIVAVVVTAVGAVCAIAVGLSISLVDSLRGGSLPSP